MNGTSRNSFRLFQIGDVSNEKGRSHEVGSPFGYGDYNTTGISSDATPGSGLPKANKTLMNQFAITNLR